MRCDDVFEILTSGPFPRGAASDGAVERHLESCHECRRFAEALRPLSESEADSALPLYRGQLAGAAIAVESVNLVDRVQAIVVRENVQRQIAKQAQKRSTKKGRVRLAVACCAICLIGAAAFGGPILARGFSAARVGDKNGTPVPIQVTFAQGTCTGKAVPHLKSEAAVPLSLRDLKEACCLTCHGGLPTQEAHRAAIGLVVLSCQKCHQEKSQWVRL